MKAGGGADQDYEDETVERPVKKSNSLPIWGNEKSMNLNSLILTNIQSSQYFKVNLYQLKTYHEVIDEIYYKVNHLEPWEKGSRKTSGQTGMCGGVRGVGAGGIVSTAFCILYKLYTLKLTRKQVQGLINHADSPYIRGLGFMYIRFTQPPADLWDWFEGYLDDEEEIDVRAGGGQTSTIGTIVRHMLTKLEWHSTLFPRIPVPIQKDIEKKLNEKGPMKMAQNNERYSAKDCVDDTNKRKEETNGEYRKNRDYQERDERERKEREDKYRERDNKEKEKYRDRHREKERSNERVRERSNEKVRERSNEKVRERDRDRRSRDNERDRRHHRHHHQSSRGHYRERRERERSYSYEIEREKERIKREKKKSSRSRSRSKDRSRRHRDY